MCSTRPPTRTRIRRSTCWCRSSGAAEVTTVDTDTSAFVEGAFGTPRGVSWYLTPAVYDQGTDAYALAPQAYAAGPAIGALHEDVIHVVRGAGYAVPTAVRVYDYPLH